MSNHIPTTDKNGWIRWIANGIQLVGYFILIHNNMEWGLPLKGFSDLLLIYWGVRNRLWDVVGVTLIFTVMNFQRAYELWVAKSQLLILLTG